MIGVAGGSQTGKTTLAWGLEDRLGADVSVLWFDEYYHDQVHLTPDERALVNYDHPDSLDVDLLVSHLDGLLAGRPAEAPVYDFTTHTRTGTTRRVDPRPVIVVDGRMVSGSTTSSIRPAVSAARTRSKAASNSSVRFTVSPCRP